MRNFYFDISLLRGSRLLFREDPTVFLSPHPNYFVFADRVEGGVSFFRDSRNSSGLSSFFPLLQLGPRTTLTLLTPTATAISPFFLCSARYWSPPFLTFLPFAILVSDAPQMNPNLFTPPPPRSSPRQRCQTPPGSYNGACLLTFASFSYSFPVVLSWFFRGHTIGRSFHLQSLAQAYRRASLTSFSARDVYLCHFLSLQNLWIHFPVPFLFPFRFEGGYPNVSPTNRLRPNVAMPPLVFLESYLPLTQ